MTEPQTVPKVPAGEEPETISIDGTPHKVADLSELAKYYISHLQSVATKLQGLKFEITQCEVTNNGFMELLRKEIAEPKTEEAPPQAAVN